MAETISIPPSPPTTVLSGNTPIAPITPASAPQLNLTEIPVNQAPAALTQAAALPTSLEGIVVAGDPQTQGVSIQTAAGEIDVQVSTALLPPGTEVSIKVYTDKLKTLADIAVFRQTMAQPQQLEQPAQPPPPPMLTEGQTVTALLLPEKPPVQIEQPGAAVLPPQEKTSLKTEPSAKLTMASDIPQAEPEIIDNNLLQIMSAQLHARETLRALQSPAPAIDSPSKSQAPAPLRYSEENLFLLNAGRMPAFSEMTEKEIFQADALLPKNMYQLTILKIFTPDTPPDSIKTAQMKLTESFRLIPPQQAEVETLTPSGFPILKTADSHFALKAPVSVPVGSVVIFEAMPMTPEQIIASMQPQGTENIPPAQDRPAPAFDPLLSTAWPALQEALQALQQTDPAVAQLLRHSLPTPTLHLAPAALFFLAALRGGALDNWLGNNTLKALRAAGKNDLIERLGGDFGRISGQSRETLADAWRSISIPLLHDDQVSQMQFYVRHQQDQENNGKDGAQKPITRFVLNLHLSRIGDMQLDGFIRKKHFDIVLRTEEKLPFSMKQELMGRFAQGLDQVQMQGGISFQTRQQGWVTPELQQQTGTFI